MILTQGEKMVWAAAFVDVANRMFGTGLNDQEVADHAAVRACQYVIAMRKAKCPEGDEDCNTVQMVRAMLGDEG